MGSLKDVVVQSDVVETAGGSFTVGPLTAADILGIFVGYRVAVERMFESFKSEKSTENDIFVELIVTFPELVAEIIARGAGEPDDASISQARRLDVGAQLTALEKIGELTVSSVGGLGNLASLIQRLSGGVSEAMVQNVSPLPNGSTTSESSVPYSQETDTKTPGDTPSG